MLADRAACRRHGARALVSAFARLVEAGAPPPPAGAVAAADTSVRARLDLRLDVRAHRVQAALLVLAAVAVLVLPTVLVVLPWLSRLAR